MDPIDRARVAALAQQPADLLSKAIPPAADGLTAAAFLGSGRPLIEFPLPLLTLDRSALAANVASMQAWLAPTGMVLAPHGKTTMAPQLWQQQLDAGAWGITLANAAQLKVGWRFGVQTVMIANPVLDQVALRWIATAPAAFRLIVWADSTAAVEQMATGLAGVARPVEVCVELGSPGGRTGARTVTEARAVARAVVEADHLALAGVAGYEGALAHDGSATSLSVVDAYLGQLRALHESLAGDYQISKPIVTAGGSAYFDRVAEVLGPLTGTGAEVVLRSGAYLVHDDGFYAGISPLNRQPGSGRFRSAMHAWSRVLSRPEPGLALLDAGKRDLSFDEGLPVAPQLAGSQVTAINDQHLFLRLAPGTELAIGEVVRLGLSHPCTALDKWSVIPLVDDAGVECPMVVDLIRTFF